MIDEVEAIRMLGEALPARIEVRVTRADIDAGVPGVPWHCALAVALRRITGTYWGVVGDQAPPDCTRRWYTVDENLRNWVHNYDGDDGDARPISGTLALLEEPR